MQGACVMCTDPPLHFQKEEKDRWAAHWIERLGQRGVSCDEEGAAAPVVAARRSGWLVQ
jgi:hypothetical protein